MGNGIIWTVVAFVVAIAIVLLILKLIGKSMKMIRTILINAIVGFIALFVLNLIPGIDLNYNWWSGLITGLLGIPGVVIVVILQLVVGWK